MLLIWDYLLPFVVSVVNSGIWLVKLGVLKNNMKKLSFFIVTFKPRFRIRLRNEAELFNKSKCSRTIFK